MKSLFKFFMLLLIISACNNDVRDNRLVIYSSATDTLILKTQKVKGSGLFLLGGGQAAFLDTAEFITPIIYPNFLVKIKRKQINTNPWSSNPQFVEIISGIKEGVEVFIVDQNNNKDLTDDSIRIFEDYLWKSSENSIQCTLNLPLNDTFFVDTSWIKLGKHNGGLIFARDEYLSTEFQLDSFRYNLGIIDQVFQSTFTYGVRPEVAILSENENVKDTLLKADLLQKDEFLHLSDQHYRFDSISPYGRYMWLVKEAKFKNKIGTQIGMIAPDFNATTLDGENISRQDFNDRPVLVANTCACGGDTISATAYYEVKNDFNNKLHAIRLDSEIKDSRIGIHIEMRNSENKDLYDKYRNAYCSRTAFLINQNNRIVDKFSIKDWRNHVPKYFEKGLKD